MERQPPLKRPRLAAPSAPELPLPLPLQTDDALLTGLRPEDVQSAAPGQPITSVLVDAYLAYLMRTRRRAALIAPVMDTTFYLYVSQWPGDDYLRRLTAQLCHRNPPCAIIIPCWLGTVSVRVPVGTGHWVLCVLVLRGSHGGPVVLYADSLDSAGTALPPGMDAWLAQALRDRPYAVINIRSETQAGGNDCGLHMLRNVEWLLTGDPATATDVRRSIPPVPAATLRERLQTFAEALASEDTVDSFLTSQPRHTLL
jgi:hypothetical protein